MQIGWCSKMRTIAEFNQALEELESKVKRTKARLRKYETQRIELIQGRSKVCRKIDLEEGVDVYITEIKDRLVHTRQGIHWWTNGKDRIGHRRVTQDFFNSCVKCAIVRGTERDFLEVSDEEVEEYRRNM